MLTVKENERLTRVGPGTPTGELLRRYWQPIGAAVELDDNPVRHVKILGESLVLYRDRLGHLGLIGDTCPHRRTSMLYGIPEDEGLRCPYHGWLFNHTGQCIEMPAEAPDSTFPCRVKTTAYPVEELCGLIYAYLGPQPVPLLPRWDMLVRTDMNKTITPTLLPCNWLQCMDNSLDPAHFEHLHGVYGNYVMERLGKPPMLYPGRHVKIDFEVFEYGIYKRRLLEGQPEDTLDWTVGHPILFPNILAQGNADSMSFQFRVPVDDTHTHDCIVDAVRPKDGEPLWEEPVV